MKGRKFGCPVNIKNWLIEILDPATADTFVRINGLTSMSRSIEGDTEDGAGDGGEWAEPYITKRNGSVSFEGKPVVNAVTGEPDEGQNILRLFAEEIGCDADATLRLTDPYGRRMLFDCIITSVEESSDSSGSTISYETEMVGEPEYPAYVQVTSVELDPATAQTLSVGDSAKLIQVNVKPDGASNGRFKVSNSNRKAVAVKNITENSFSLLAIATGSAVITVTTVNNNKTVTLNVTVS